jgi:hypothetical protein
VDARWVLKGYESDKGVAREKMMSDRAMKVGEPAGVPPVWT